MRNEKKKIINLQQVTLIAVTSVNIYPTIRALMHSMAEIEFGDVKIVTHKKPLFLPRCIKYQYIDKIDCIDKFNYAMVYDLHKFVDTEYALLIHADGFVVNPGMWNDDFLKYDYIGAPWPIPPKDDTVTYRDASGTLYRVGNSVSLRSEKLMKLPSELELTWNSYHGWYNEDGFLCVHNRKLFEKHGVKYAPVEVAVKFAQESMIPESDGIVPFAFHKWDGNNSKYPNKFFCAIVKKKDRLLRKLHIK